MVFTVSWGNGDEGYERNTNREAVRACEIFCLMWDCVRM